MTTKERTAGIPWRKEQLEALIADIARSEAAIAAFDAETSGTELNEGIPAIRKRFAEIRARLEAEHADALEGISREAWMREIARGVRAERMADPALVDDPSRGDD